MSAQPNPNLGNLLGNLSQAGAQFTPQTSRWLDPFTEEPAAHSTLPYAKVPQELKDLSHWVVWREEKRNGKLTKPPYEAKNNDFAKSNDPTTWCDFATAVKVASVPKNKYNGIGIMLLGARLNDIPLVGIDFDGVIDDGVPEPYVLNIISQFGAPYCEITPSGTGLRVFVKCFQLSPGGRKFSAKKKGVEKYGAEIYTSTEGGRFLTVTGDRFSGGGIPRIDDISLPYLLISQFANVKFKHLWMGDASDYENDQSRGDLALLGLLSRELKTQDKDALFKFFSASPRGHREKWLDREDYRERTFKKLVSGEKPESAASDEVGEQHQWEPLTESQKYKLDFKFPPSTNQSDSEFVMAPVEGDDGWFPLGAVSLVGGKSGSGKTTTMYQALTMQGVKIPFFGHQTFGRSFLATGVDRGKASHSRTMKRMRLSPEAIPFNPISQTLYDIAAARAILNVIEEQNPLPEIVFIEGVDMMVSKGTDPILVSQFVHAITQIAEHYHIAMIGSGGAPKSNETNQYSNPRECFYGSQAWARTTETLLTLSIVPKKKGRRRLHVDLRNGPDEDFTLEFQGGLLVPIADDPEESVVTDDSHLDIEWYREQARRAKTDPTKKWWTIRDFEVGRKMTYTPASTRVKHDHAHNHLIKKSGRKMGKGGASLYCWNESETNPLGRQDQDEQREVF